MKNSTLIIVTSIFILTACNNEPKKEKQSVPTEQQKVETPNVKKALDISQEKRILTINDQQFKFKGNKLTTSSKLQNLRTSQLGSVSGSFVIFSKERPSPYILGLTFNDDAKLIAPNTWRFTANRGTDFLTLYKQLKAKYKKVEMSIRYGSSNKEEQ